jgi:hypothetical protein
MMALPYENTTSGEKAIQEMQKILQRFGCSTFGQMMDWDKGELIIQFQYRGMPIHMKASVNGYAQAWLKEHPYGSRMRVSKVDYERKAKQIAGIAVYSVLRDWIKGQVTAIETGILSFEGAFLGQIMLPNGKTVMDHVTASKMLPAPK